jgi:hypothetical protein
MAAGLVAQQALQLLRQSLHILFGRKQRCSRLGSRVAVPLTFSLL